MAHTMIPRRIKTKASRPSPARAASRPTPELARPRPAPDLGRLPVGSRISARVSTTRQAPLSAGALAALDLTGLSGDPQTCAALVLSLGNGLATAVGAACSQFQRRGQIVRVTHHLIRLTDPQGGASQTVMLSVTGDQRYAEPFSPWDAARQDPAAPAVRGDARDADRLVEFMLRRLDFKQAGDQIQLLMLRDLIPPELMAGH